MKKICFVTTVSITIKSFLLQFKDYLVDNDYDVTFICNTDESMYLIQIALLCRKNFWTLIQSTLL